MRVLYEPKKVTRAFKQLGFYEERSNKHIIMKRANDNRIISLATPRTGREVHIGLIKRELSRVGIEFETWYKQYQKA